MLWPTKKRKPPQPETPERDIFEFWDGSESRRIDPLPLWYKIWQTEDILTLLKRAGSNESEATAELTTLARAWFRVPPYEPKTQQGLTELEVNALLTKYFEYCQELKKKVGPLPMPWQTLVQAQSSDESTTPPAAESSSSPSELPSDEPSTASTPSPPSSTTT